MIDRPGRFVVLEGIEGSGKSTQARLLGEWLTSWGIPHLLTREPGGTSLGEEIRNLLLHSGAVPPMAELLLMLAARATLLEEQVRPALAAGTLVVADRYDVSTLAYQGYGRGLDLDVVRRMNESATGGLRPDLVLLLDAPQSVGVSRRAATRSGEDRIERAGVAFHERVGEAYRLLAQTEPNVQMIDATPGIEDVHATVVGVLSERFPELMAVQEDR